MANEHDSLALIEEISTIGRQAGDDLRETLDQLVAAVAAGLEVEVCSLYVFDPERQRLVLRATLGLNSESVGKVSMRVDEGLVGLAVESGEAVNEPDAMSHPRYKYFPETGEERYHALLAVPVWDEAHKPLGVLVVQTLRRRVFEEAEVRTFRAAANQVAQVFSRFRLRESLLTKEKERDEYRRRMIEANRQLKSFEKIRGTTRLVVAPKVRRPRLKGLAAVPGFAQGSAHVASGLLAAVNRNLRAQDPKAELQRLEEALARSRNELVALKNRMAALMAETELRVFDGHRLILEDQEFVGRIRTAIESGYAAPSALLRVVDELAASLGAVADGYLRDRATDLRDVGQRLLRHLERGAAGQAFDRPTVLVAEELTLSQLTLISHENLVGIALGSGGVTSHAAILARSFEIPTVVGVEHLMEAVIEGDSLVIDGNSGVVYVSPAPEIEREYGVLISRYQDFKRELMSQQAGPSTTRDGRRVRILANIALPSDIAVALGYGAEGIGLLRTEFSFFTYEDFPDEEQQVALYRSMIEAVGQRPVTIRTLDIGADKYPPYLRVPREANPFLGWRSIRISLELADVFKAQLRAIMRAAARRDVSLLMPMISSVEELRKALAILAEAQDELSREGREYKPDLPVGIMVEVPSAVWLASHLVREVDFFSIGTNDLIQYLLATDRNNPRVAHLYEGLHPAVLSAVAEVVGVGRAAGKEVSICGELASDPLATLLLVGIGFDHLSLSPLFIPVVRKIVRETNYQTARLAAHDVLQMATVQDVKAYLIDRYRDLGLMRLVEMYR